MRQSVRNLRHKVIKESKEPQSGAYWWIPIPQAIKHPIDKTKITWDLITFYDGDYPTTDHITMWPEALEYIALKWGKDPDALKNALDINYAALPRGRVSKVKLAGDQSGYAILHGKDSPKDLGGIVNAFNLRAIMKANQLKIAYDDHERIMTDDLVQFQKAMGLPDLGLKGISPEDLF